MNFSLLVLDNFVPQPETLRELALGLKYRSYEFDGHSYDGVGVGFDPCICGLVEKAVGFKIKKRLDFFRLGMNGVRMSGFIHADQNCGEFAGVLYLNLPRQQYGGTSFWRHRQFGISEMPDKMSAEDLEELKEDSLHEKKWELDAHVEMRFGRFITYPTKKFHSRYPNEIEAATKEEGRLIYAIFFDRA